METLAFLSAHSAALTVIFTGAVTVATIVYATLTWKLVSETRLMRQVQTEPRIEISVSSAEVAVNLVRLKIKNIGQGPAINLKLTPRVVKDGGAGELLIEDFTSVSFFDTGISYLGPNDIRFSGLTEMNQKYEEKVSSVIAIDIEYSGSSGKVINESVSIDFSEHRGTYRIGEPLLYSVAKSLEALQRDLRRISQGSTKIKVETYDKADRNAAREEMLRQRAEFQARKDSDQ